MAEFSEGDLDRPWSAGELGQLSERDLAKLAFRRALKNAAFFAPAAVVLGLVAGSLGLAGKIIGWVAIMGLVVFALEPLAGLATGVIALVGVVAGENPTADRGVSWRLLQLLVALTNVALYAGLAYWVYTRTRA